MKMNLIQNAHGDRNTEIWRSVKKLGSLLGDYEGLRRRKQLSIVAMNNTEKVWIRKDHFSETHRLKLYRTLVKSVLLCNCGTWRLTKQDKANLESFHCQQLRKIIGKNILIKYQIRCRTKMSNRTAITDNPKTTADTI